jgi:hypothetical protein
MSEEEWDERRGEGFEEEDGMKRFWWWVACWALRRARGAVAVAPKLSEDEVGGRLVADPQGRLLEAVVAVLRDVENDAVDQLQSLTLRGRQVDVLRGWLGCVATVEAKLVTLKRRGERGKLEKHGVRSGE